MSTLSASQSFINVLNKIALLPVFRFFVLGLFFVVASAFGQVPMAASAVAVTGGNETFEKETMAEVAFCVSIDTISPNKRELKKQFDTLEKLTEPVDTAGVAKRSVLPPREQRKLEEQVQEAMKQAFVPVPQRALWLALVLPGAGQIYNRKYWKLPIVYGGFLGCTYAYLWNQQMYSDYSQAYLDIMDDDPTTDSYRAMFPPTYDIDGRLEQFKTVFKNRKDRYRRYRDLSAICFIGVYLLSVVDAYVDAQLSVFDISPDLSLRVSPSTIETYDGFRTTQTMGLGATLTF